MLADPSLDDKLTKKLGSEQDLERLPLADGSALYALASPGADIRGMVIDEEHVRPDYGQAALTEGA